MALKCAIELGIPDAIQKHGKPTTLTELANALQIHPRKAPSLHRLMRLLSHSNFFSNKKIANGEVIFDLTINSKLLIMDHPLTLAPYVLAVLDPIMTDPAHHIGTWFKNDATSPFHIAHGRSVWENASILKKFNNDFNKAMGTDSRFVASFLMPKNETNGLFEGTKSLVDVGGGDGTLARNIAKAYPGMNCIVYDLPHVVEGLQADEPNLVYVGGDMFEAIPHADVVLLKFILHGWSDDHCIKILERCKEAIPNKEQGGKVIIIDMVVGGDQNTATKDLNAQFLYDMEMMSLTIGGKERTEDEWKKLFTDAGYTDYKILSILGVRSIIELYPS